MSRRLRFYQVDVFTRVPLQGNPLAVFPFGEHLTNLEMQAIAREMNLSETTFVLPAEDSTADYQVRIFTPGRELPFAGHPTLGTAHALIECGLVKSHAEQFVLRQQTLAGIQSIAVSGRGGQRLLTMTQPSPSFSEAPARDELAAALGIEAAALIGSPRTVAVGVAWHVAEVESLELLARLEPDMDLLSSIERRTGAGTSVFCEGALDRDCAVRVRSFAPGIGVPEDPVCGSGNGCVGAFRAARDRIREPMIYRAEQGIETGRPGRVEVRIDPAADAEHGFRVQVGGEAVTVLEGELRLST